jgi:ATP-dependent DNA helicase PIF1
VYILDILKSNLNNLLPDNFELSKEFEDISQQIEHSDDNFYITGKAGSGKSTLLSYFRTIKGCGSRPNWSGGNSY